MNTPLPKYVAVFLVSALAVTACGQSDAVSPTAPAGVNKSVIAIEPATVAPEFFPTPLCPRFSPFGARFTLVVRSGEDLVLRVVQFNFIDRFGGRTVPSVVPLDTAQAPAPSTPGSSPIPFPTPSTLPSASPVPIPSGGFDPLLIPGGTSREVPFLLSFGCGVPSDGTVVITLEMFDRRGTAETSEVRVRVKG
jgi:hypothetical protein